MTVREGFKFVAADFTTRDHTFSYLDAVRTGTPVVQPDATTHDDPCPRREGDGLCVAVTVAAASSGGQPASTATGLAVEFNDDDVLAEADGKVRVRALRVTGVFDPMYLIRLGLCTDLRGAYLRGAYLQYADLRDADLRGANLRGADLRRANLRDADLRRANLQHADLRRANLRHANLGGTDLRGADLEYADLRHANLRGAYLRRADLWGVNLWGADLQYADLRDADLGGADLRDADLRHADLRDANLGGAYLRDADLRDAYLRDAWANDQTVLPGGWIVQDGRVVASNPDQETDR